MYKSNQDRHQMFSKSGRTGAKPGGAGAAGFAKVRAAAKIAGAAGVGMESTMQPRAPAGLVEGGGGTRASVGGASAAGEDGAPGKDKKKAQVKDFYSNLLNKSKGAAAKKKPVEK